MLASIRLFFSLLGRLSPSLAGRLAAVLFARPRRHRRPAREHSLIATLGARRMTASGQGHCRILFAPDTIDGIVRFIEQGRVVGSSSNATVEHS